MTEVESILQPKASFPIERQTRNETLTIPSAKSPSLALEFLRVADLCLVWFSTCLAYFLLGKAVDLRSLATQPILEVVPLGSAFLFSVLVVLFAELRGLYDFPWKRIYVDDLRRLADAIICAGIVTATGSYLGASGLKPVGAVAVAAILAGVLLAGFRPILPGRVQSKNFRILRRALRVSLKPGRDAGRLSPMGPS